MLRIGRIEFLPTCSECKRIIPGPIDCYDEGEESPEIDGKRRLFIGSMTIVPRQCPHCGATFDSIITIARLPFDGYATREGPQ